MHCIHDFCSDEIYMRAHIYQDTNTAVGLEIIYICVIFNKVATAQLPYSSKNAVLAISFTYTIHSHTRFYVRSFIEIGHTYVRKEWRTYCANKKCNSPFNTSFHSGQNNGSKGKEAQSSDHINWLSNEFSEHCWLWLLSIMRICFPIHMIFVIFKVAFVWDVCQDLVLLPTKHG